MRLDQLNERFNKADWAENESNNLHTENAVEIAHAFGTREEVAAMERIADQHMRRGHILPHEIEERSALVKKYYSMLENTTSSNSGVNETLSPEEKRLVNQMYNKDGTLTDLGKRVMDHGKTVKESTQMMTESQFDEAAGEKDACYRKVKSRYKVWPSAYASGALTKCRKVGAANWGKSKK